VFVQPHLQRSLHQPLPDETLAQKLLIRGGRCAHSQHDASPLFVAAPVLLLEDSNRTATCSGMATDVYAECSEIPGRYVGSLPCTLLHAGVVITPVTP
jgi:hypothetical protein